MLLPGQLAKQLLLDMPILVVYNDFVHKLVQAEYQLQILSILYFLDSLNVIKSIIVSH